MRWDVASPLDRTPDGEPTGSRVLVVDEEGLVGFAPAGTEPRPDDVWVGRESGIDWWAREGSPSGATTSFRATPSDLIATAMCLVRWHAEQPPCERCGGATAPEQRGRIRRCLECGAMLFFRTDPAVIVAITDPDDRLLLARQRTWAPGRVSVIAGFVEPGESAEQACAREAREETALAITDIRWFGSQPWPFPRSLMLGFTAKVEDPSVLRVDGVELEEASFLTREELASKLDAGELTLPGPASIGRALVDVWRG